MKMQLCASDIGHQSVYSNGFYELSLSRRIRKLARAGGLMVDVGANYGYFSMLWLANNPGNRCIAFEASPANIPALAENIHRNRLDERMSIEPCALSDRTGTVEFALHTGEGQTGWGGISNTPAADTFGVPATTLDGYWVRNCPDQNIAVLKIDVEGADTLVLQGAQNLLRSQKIRHIFFEINRPRMQLLGISEHRASELLKAHGYRLEQVDADEMHAFV